MNLDGKNGQLTSFKYNVESDKRRKQPFYKNAFFLFIQPLENIDSLQSGV